MTTAAVSFNVDLIERSIIEPQGQVWPVDQRPVLRMGLSENEMTEMPTKPLACVAPAKLSTVARIFGEGLHSNVSDPDSHHQIYQ